MPACILLACHGSILARHHHRAPSPHSTPPHAGLRGADFGVIKTSFMGLPKAGPNKSNQTGDIPAQLTLRAYFGPADTVADWDHPGMPRDSQSHSSSPSPSPLLPLHPTSPPSGPLLTSLWHCS